MNILNNLVFCISHWNDARSFWSTSKCVDNVWTIIIWAFQTFSVHLLCLSTDVWILFLCSPVSTLIWGLSKAHFLKAAIFTHWRHSQTSLGYCNNYCKRLNLVDNSRSYAYFKSIVTQGISLSPTQCKVISCLISFSQGTSLLINGVYFLASSYLSSNKLKTTLQQVSIKLSKLANCLGLWFNG